MNILLFLFSFLFFVTGTANLAAARMTHNTALQALGLDPMTNPSENQIRKAYLKLCADNHPDKWTGKAAADVKKAGERFKEAARAKAFLGKEKSVAVSLPADLFDNPRYQGTSVYGVTDEDRSLEGENEAALNAKRQARITSERQLKSQGDAAAVTWGLLPRHRKLWQLLGKPEWHTDVDSINLPDAPTDKSSLSPYFNSGIRPSLITDAIDTLTFTSANKKLFTLGMALAVAGKLGDVVGGESLIRNSLSKKDLSVLRRSAGDEIQFLDELREDKLRDETEHKVANDCVAYQDAADKLAFQGFAHTASVGERSALQPALALAEHTYMGANIPPVQVWNEYMARNPDDVGVKKHKASIGLYRMALGVLMLSQALAGLGSSLTHTGRKTDPSVSYPLPSEGNLIQRGNRLALLESALGLVQNGLRIMMKRAHISRAQEHDDAEWFRTLQQHRDAAEKEVGEPTDQKQ